MKAKYFFFSIVLIITGIVIGTALTVSFDRDYQSLGTEIGRIDEEKVKPAISLSKAFTEVADNCRPAVIYIFSEKIIRRRSLNPFIDEFFGDILGEDFLEKYYGIPQERKSVSLGTGFIVREDGIVLTNTHVIEGADKIFIKIDESEEYEAKLIGEDRGTDIAVLKINSDKKFKYLRLGDSDKLKVGEWVIAIGNPFGLTRTVTAGIVSALGRGDVTNTEYEDYIQTDASINPGNSGGPLINLKAEVIGMNAAIYSTSGGNIGIGFAIPSNLLKKIMEDLLDDGIVDRGWLGIYVQNLNEGIAEKLGINGVKGVIITDIKKESPSFKAGLKKGDVITAIDNKKIENYKDLADVLAQIPVNKTVPAEIIRDGKKMTINIYLASRYKNREGGKHSIENLGLTVKSISRTVLRRLKIYGISGGIIVEDVRENTTAFKSGIKINDIIIEINEQSITDTESFIEVLSQISDREPLRFTIIRNGKIFYRYIND
ncbi:MAG: Do family serine endopeptidase [Candidatus Hydrogenedentota bacterium]